MSSAQARVVRAKRDLVVSRNVYYSVFGVFPGNFTKAPFPAVPYSALPKTLYRANAIAKVHNTELISLLHQVAIARSKIKNAMSTFGPSIKFEGEAVNDDNVDGLQGLKKERVVGVDLTYNIFNSGGDLASVRAARSTYYAAEDTYHNELWQVRKDVDSDWELYKSSRVNYQYLLRQSLQLDRFLVLAQHEVELGRRSLVDLIVADTNSINAETQAVSAKAEVIVAAYDLLQSMGVLNVGAVK